MAAASGAPRDDPSSEPSTAAVAVDVTTAPLDAIGDVAAAVETVPATPEENTRGNADDETRDSAGADLATTHDIEDSTSSDVQLDEFDDFVNASATGQGPWEVHTAGTIVRNLPEHDDGSHSPLPFPGDFAGTDGVMSGGNPSQTVPLWASSTSAQHKTIFALTGDRALPKGLVGWAVGPFSHHEAPHSTGSSIDFHSHGPRYSSVLLPGHRDPPSSNGVHTPYRGAWASYRPPRDAADMQEQISAAQKGPDAPAAAAPADGQEAASAPRWLSGEGRARVDAVVDLIVLPDGGDVRHQADTLVLAAALSSVDVDSGPDAVVAAADAMRRASDIVAGTAAAAHPAASGAARLPPLGHRGSAPTLPARHALGVKSIHAGDSLGAVSRAEEGTAGSQLVSLRLTQALIAEAGDGADLLLNAPRELTASLLRVFSPDSHGSFHHACTVLQRLVMVRPLDVAEAVVAGGRRCLQRIMAFLHHPPVADTLVQLLTLAHAASAQGGAGPSAGAGAGSMAGALFGGPPSDDELGALYAKKPAAPTDPEALTMLHEAMERWDLLPELVRHITTYGAAGTSFGPHDLFAGAAEAGPTDAASVASSPATGRAAVGLRAASISSQGSARAAEDAVRPGDEGDDPVATALAGGADEAGLHAAAEAAHVEAAADALIQLISVMREQPVRGSDPLGRLAKDPSAVPGLVEAASGGTLLDAQAAHALGSPLASPPALQSTASATASAALPASVGADARCLAAIRCLRAITSLCFEQNLPSEGPTSAGPAGQMQRVLLHNPFHDSAHLVTTRLLKSLPRLAGHLACLHELLHPGEAERHLQLAARARKLAKKRAKKKKGKGKGNGNGKGKGGSSSSSSDGGATDGASSGAASEAATAASSSLSAELASTAASNSAPSSASSASSTAASEASRTESERTPAPALAAAAVRHQTYTVDVPFGLYRLEATRVIGAIVERCPGPALAALGGDAAAAALAQHLATVHANRLPPTPTPTPTAAAGAAASGGGDAAAAASEEGGGDAAAASGAGSVDRDEDSTAAALAASLAPPAALGGWSGPGVWGALMCWAVMYPHCDAFHRCLEDLIRRAFLCDDEETITRMVVKGRMLPLMLAAALGEDPKAAGAGSLPEKPGPGTSSARRRPPASPVRALALRVLAMVRLYREAHSRDHFFVRYLDANPVWNAREAELKELLLEQRRDNMPLPPRPGSHNMAGLPPAIMAMLAAMQQSQAVSPQTLAREKHHRESIDLGGKLAEELGFGDISADPRAPDVTPAAVAGTGTGGGATAAGSQGGSAGIAAAGGRRDSSGSAGNEVASPASSAGSATSPGTAGSPSALAALPPLPPTSPISAPALPTPASDTAVAPHVPEMGPEEDSDEESARSTASELVMDDVD